MRIKWSIAIIILTVITIYFLFWLFMIKSEYFTSFEMRGQYGDMFGMLNTFFSALAFGGVIYTIIVQQEQIRRHDDEKKEQDKLNQIDQFEATFFEMLQLQNEIVKLMDYRAEGRVVSVGRDCFRTWYSDFRKNVIAFAKRQLVGKVWNQELEPPNISRLIVVGHVINIYEGILNKNSGDLDHYFRHLYNIIRFVHEAKISADKRSYIRLVRAQLSSYEIVFLFCNCLIKIWERKI